MSDTPTIDRYTRENWTALQVFDDSGSSEWNGVDGRTLHALARRGLLWFEAVDPWAKAKRYRGGLTEKGRAVLTALTPPAAEEEPLSPDDFENELYRRALALGGDHGIPWVSRLVTNIVADARELYELSRRSGDRLRSDRGL